MLRKKKCENRDEDTGKLCGEKAVYKCPTCKRVFCERCEKIEWSTCPFCEPPELVKI